MSLGAVGLVGLYLKQSWLIILRVNHDKNLNLSKIFAVEFASSC